MCIKKNLKKDFLMQCQGKITFTFLSQYETQSHASNVYSICYQIRWLKNWCHDWTALYSAFDKMSKLGYHILDIPLLFQILGLFCFLLYYINFKVMSSSALFEVSYFLCLCKSPISSIALLCLLVVKTLNCWHSEQIPKYRRDKRHYAIIVLTV